ncbi:helix-hairpin-helix domain-containing protein [Microbacterium enclense]|uniref:helix-hairpin-helix domain-containing protein n=1 Tax=Microbacterium enclense TaxID=993073 RepID=UPI003F7EA84B
MNDIAVPFGLYEADMADMPFSDTVYGPVRAYALHERIMDAVGQPLNRVITALGIRKTGRTFGRRLAAHLCSLSALLEANQEELLAVEGVGDRRANIILDGLTANRGNIDRLIALDIDPRVNDADLTDRPLAGMSVVVFGAMSGPLAPHSRTKMNELIESQGGRASSSVSKITSLHVTSETTASKAIKAAQLGLRTITPEAFVQMIGLSK